MILHCLQYSPKESHLSTYSRKTKSLIKFERFNLGNVSSVLLASSNFVRRHIFSFFDGILKSENLISKWLFLRELLSDFINHT